MSAGNLPYIDGFVIPVPESRKQDYLELAQIAAEVFMELGALEVMESWGDDVPRGERTDFYRAVEAGEGEGIVLSWILWPSKEVRDKGNAIAAADPRITDSVHEVIFNSRTMIYSCFQSVLHRRAEGYGR